MSAEDSTPIVLGGLNSGNGNWSRGSNGSDRPRGEDVGCADCPRKTQLLNTTQTNVNRVASVMWVK